MNFGELFVQLGAIGNSKKVKEFADAVEKTGKAIDNFDNKQKKVNKNAFKMGQSLGKTLVNMTALVGAIAGAYWALDRLTSSLVKQNQHWLDLTRQSDIALSSYQKWGMIGKIVGIENAEQQLESLNQKLFNLRLTGEGARGFQMAGIIPTTSEDVLEQLRSRISGMSNTSASYLLQQMGLDPRMITLLRMGRDEWEQYVALQNKFTLNEDQRRDLDKLNRQLEVARIKMRYFRDRALLAIMPVFVKFTQGIARITELLVKFLEKSWRVLGVLALWSLRFKAVHSFLKGISGSITTLIAKIPKFGSAFLALGKVFSRVLLPLTALFLMLDDLAVFFSGGDSLIGRVLEWGKEKGGGIAEGFAKMFGGDILGGTSQILSTSLDALNDILQTIASLLENIVNFFTFGLYGKFMNSSIGKALFPSIEDRNKWIDNQLSPQTRGIISQNQRINNISNNSPISMPITIYTNETAQSINDQLIYAQMLGVSN